MVYVIPALRRVRQGGSQEFEASLGCRMKLIKPKSNKPNETKPSFPHSHLYELLGTVALLSPLYWGIYSARHWEAFCPMVWYEISLQLPGLTLLLSLEIQNLAALFWVLLTHGLNQRMVGKLYFKLIMNYDPWLWKTIKEIPGEEEQINVLEKQGLSSLRFINKSVELKK